ncbi:ACT domain-containing protein ACR9-like [Zingiber officinale]|nr:ACT domain-containing protein ACR9-like [Zingiber officinale]XP_042461889.1 ACT domain-containing protein ACR9-like [Zingiber officinale]KAG6527822.1 hypothetical protein ZIOFF_009956 [Zingiber officinale]
MVAASEGAVVIQSAKRAGEPTIVTVSCPDQTGLGCDFCRAILDFGLCIARGDVSTDGKWCYFVFWVIPRSASSNIHWLSLKNRLFSLCPSSSIPFYYDVVSRPTTSQIYLLKLFSVDRKGLLHDVTKVLCELEFTIERVKVSTTPDGRVVDLFFITDAMELLDTKARQNDLCEKLDAVLQESVNLCEIELVEDFQFGFSSLPEAVSEELFKLELSGIDSQRLSPEMKLLNKADVKIDNSLSPSHTLLQVHCVDQKGLLYDIMRTLKDCNIQVSYGRFLSDLRGSREVDLLIQQSDGNKVADHEKQGVLCSRLKMEMLHPLRVTITTRGPDTELLVANPVELCGRGRPRVFYDITLALKVLGICIFSAEIGRHTAFERQWEVYRFLLDDSRELQLANSHARSEIVDRVRRTLMGW